MLNGLGRTQRTIPVISVVINKCPDCPVTTPRETWRGTHSQTAAFAGQRLGKDGGELLGSLITQHGRAISAFDMCLWNVSAQSRAVSAMHRTSCSGRLPELVTCLCLIKLRELVRQHTIPCPLVRSEPPYWLMKGRVATHHTPCLRCSCDPLERHAPSILLDKAVTSFRSSQLSLQVQDASWMDRKRLGTTSS